MSDVPQEDFDALVATLGDQTPDPVEAPIEQAVEAEPVEVPEDVDTGTTDESDSFRGIDPALLSVLDEPLQKALEAERKSIQSEATKRFQEAAAIRKEFEGIDLELAKNAVTYMERLSDPEFLVQAHEAMTAELERQGLTPAQANQVATEAIEEQLADDDDYDSGDTDPRITSQLQELLEFKARTEANEVEREQASRLEYLANETLKKEQLLRRDNPEWDEEDFVNLYTLAPGLKGDLLQAAEVYRKQEAQFAKRLLKTKQSIPSSITTPPSSGSSTDAAQKWTLEEGHKAAMEALRNIQAND